MPRLCPMGTLDGLSPVRRKTEIVPFDCFSFVEGLCATVRCRCCGGRLPPRRGKIPLPVGRGLARGG